MSSKLPIHKESVELLITLPAGAETRVKTGDQVAIGSVLAVKPADQIQLDLAKKLKTPHLQIEKLFNKQPGESVAVGDVLIEKRNWFKTRKIISHVNGTIVNLDQGVVNIRTQEQDQSIVSPSDGEIGKIENQTIYISIATETLTADHGWGPRTWGELEVLGSRETPPLVESIKGNFAGKILVISGGISKALWHKLIALGAQGIICSQIPDNLDQLSSDEKREPDDISIPLAVLDQPSQPLFAQSIWEWFNNLVGHVAVLDGENKKISVSKK